MREHYCRTLPERLWSGRWITPCASQEQGDKPQDGQMELFNITASLPIIPWPPTHLPPHFTHRNQRGGQAGSAFQCGYCIVFFLFSISNVTATRTDCSLAGLGTFSTSGDQAGGSDTGETDTCARSLTPTPHPRLPASQGAPGAASSQEAHSGA